MLEWGPISATLSGCPLACVGGFSSKSANGMVKFRILLGIGQEHWDDCPAKSGMFHTSPQVPWNVGTLRMGSSATLILHYLT